MHCHSHMWKLCLPCLPTLGVLIALGWFGLPSSITPLTPSSRRLFDPYTLEYMTTLPKPHHLGVRIGGFDLSEDVSAEGGGEGGEETSSARAEEVTKEYPDVVAVGIDTEQNRVRSKSDADSFLFLYIVLQWKVTDLVLCHLFN